MSHVSVLSGHIMFRAIRLLSAGCVYKVVYLLGSCSWKMYMYQSINQCCTYEVLLGSTDCLSCKDSPDFKSFAKGIFLVVAGMAIPIRVREFTHVGVRSVNDE